MKSYLLALLVVVASVSAVTPGVAADPGASDRVDNEPPLADAGLDQTVVQGTTVLLDGTGSRDPDGTIESYHWTVARPDGTTTSPDCRDCPRTSFEPREPGTYAVTLRVTDDDGAARRDTLYVTVEPGRRPTVRLDGPDSANAGETVTYSATARSGSAPLSRVVWTVDGSRVDSQEVVGARAELSLDRRFDTPGRHDVRVVVIDDVGQRRTATVSTVVRPAAGGGDPPGDPPGNPPGDDPPPSTPTTPSTSTPSPTPPGSSTTTSPTPTSTPSTTTPPSTAPTPSPTATPTPTAVATPAPTTSRPPTTTSTPRPPTPRPPTTARPPTTTPTTEPPSDDPSPSVATRASPVVRGKQLLTGRPPFEDRYRLDVDVAGSQVSEVRWLTDGTWTDVGSATDADWAAGRHTLAAEVVYVDGSEDLATFGDGSKTVVADPKPSLALSRRSRPNGVGGRITARDGFGNLDRVVVRANGTVIGRWSADYDERRDLEARTARLSFARAGRTPARISVTAVDSRGQRTTLTRVLSPNESAGKPEVVRNEFVNGPVDSYHPKIEKERYVAEHVVMIDLNGVDAEDVAINLDLKNEDRSIPVSVEGSHRIQSVTSDSITVRTYWAGKEPGNYAVNPELIVSTQDGGEMVVDPIEASFIVTPSPPEIRIDIRNGGTPHNKRQWGMVVDASESFDPDGTDLRYIWGQQARATSDEAIGKFDSFGHANLTVRDDNGQESVVHANFHHYLAPGITDVRELTQGPYRPEETVRLRISTASFELTKNRFMQDLRVGARVTEGSVVSWQRKDVDWQDGNSADRRRDRYVGVVEIEARKLAGSGESPSVVVYNAKHPQETRTSTTLNPGITTYRRSDTRLLDAYATDVSYLVERERVSERTTREPAVRDELLERGYSIVTKVVRSTTYSVDRWGKVREGEYETRTKRFETRSGRDAFVDRTRWEDGGTETESETVERTTTVWRDSRSGRGTYTGRTRVEKVEPAEYDVEYEQEYESPFGGSVTYWSDTKDAYGSWTGRERREKVDAAEYERQYEFEVTEDVQRDVIHYVAELTVQTREPEYGWQLFATGLEKEMAEGIVASDDFRINESPTETEWTLEKEEGTVTFTRDERSGVGTVQETSATVVGTVAVDYATGSAANVDVTTREKRFEVRINSDESLAEDGIRSLVRRHVQAVVDGCGESAILSECSISGT